MEKIELKHLAPYLPYGLQAINAYGNKIPIHAHHYFNDIGGYIGLHPDCKIILRPLSDINSPWMNENQMGEWMSIKNSSAFGFEELEYNEFDNIIIRMNDYSLVYSLNFEAWPVMEFLFKYHLDVFGLIEKRLAIDINTLSPKQ